MPATVLTAPVLVDDEDVEDEDELLSLLELPLVTVDAAAVCTVQLYEEVGRARSIPAPVST
jgi:hypothetical protein